MPSARRPRPVATLVAVALTLAIGLPLVAPGSLAAAGPDRPPKTPPTRVTPYRVGGTFTVDTDLDSDSGYAAWMIDAYLAAATPLPPIGQAFVRAERETGVNALYLLAHAMLESGFGTSAISQVKHNLFGFHAYDRDPGKYAERYPTFQASVREVARRIETDYLTRGGRFWAGYPTLQAMNICYASDPGWADKIALIANQINASVISLRERGIRLRGVVVPAAPRARAAVRIGVRWLGRPGSTFPRTIEFAVRWTPLAVAESGPAPRLAPPAWVAVRDRAILARAISLRVTAPPAPGLWRLDVRALDAGGDPLPKLDGLPIRSAVVRIAAPVGAGIGISIAADGRLTATLRASGKRAVATAGPTGAPTTLETWLLPLDPARSAVRTSTLRLAQPLRPGKSIAVATPANVLRGQLVHGPALVVARLTGDPSTIGRSVPAVALLSPGPTGPVLAAVEVADPRTSAALARARKTALVARRPAPIGIEASAVAGQVGVRLDAAVVAAAAAYLPSDATTSAPAGGAAATRARPRERRPGALSSSAPPPSAGPLR